MTDEQQSDSKVSQTPGQILRAAREQRGYQRANIAERLRLSARTIQDIEEDNYTHFRAEIYIRGHIRSYARMVGIDSALVLKAYEDMGIEIVSDPQIPVLLAQGLPVYRHVRRVKPKTLLLAGLGVLFVLIVMVVLWWQEQHHKYYFTKVVAPLETKVLHQVISPPPNAEALPEVPRKTTEVRNYTVTPVAHDDKNN